MKKIMIGLAAMASLTLTACGGSICDDLEDSSKSLADKGEACGLTVDDGDEVTDAERDACKEATKDCTDDDKKQVDAFVDCLNDIKDCSDKTAAEQQAFGLSVVACASKITGLSASCDL